MRIELSLVKINSFQSDLASLLTTANNVLGSFQAVKSSTYRMNGGVGILEGAVGQLEQRIQIEERRVENLKTVQKESEEFLRNTTNTDNEVASLVAQNKDEFYKMNPWSKPTVSGSVRQWISQAMSIIGGIAGSLFGNGSGSGSGSGSGKKSLWERLTSDDPADRSLVSGTTGVHEGAIGGVLPVGGQASGDLLGASAETTWHASWEDGEGLGVEAGVSVEGHLAHGEAEGHIGYLNGKVEGNVGQAEVGANATAAIFDEDGNFRPGLGVGAEASASVVSGEAEIYTGNENYNQFIHGEGELLTAGAEASAGVGVVTVERDGKEVTEVGVHAEASAEAYLAHGEASTGFTIAGIKIGVGVEGGAGGAGAHAGVSATSGGAEVDVGAGLGLGVGVKLDVDWSDFSLDKLKFWENW